MSIAVVGAGAFGTALAVAQARAGRPVQLVARDDAAAAALSHSRSSPRFPDVILPDNVSVSAEYVPEPDDVVLLAVPTQSLASVLEARPGLGGARALVACCKGIERGTLRTPLEILAVAGPEPAVLSGPGFASDIAAGRPTALVLGCADDNKGRWLQSGLSTATMRLYRTTDALGVALGGALKNVIALAAGITMGAGLGESARAAVISRGFAEMNRFAMARGARAETLAGLSGLGDLILTATSPQSRNYTHGLAVGAGREAPGGTVEGIATAEAVLGAAARDSVDMPLTSTVVAVLNGTMGLDAAREALLARPLRQE